MRRKLRIQDRLLLVLADVGDLLEELHDPGGWMANYYRTLLGWVPYRYKRSNFKRAVKQMLNAGFLEKIIKGSTPCLRITSAGKRRLVRDFPILRLYGKRWRGECTILIFDIEETRKREREKFRRFLYQLGAGKMQKSAYIIPYDLCLELQEVVENFGLGENVQVFPSNLDWVKDKKAFAFRIWKLDQMEEKYQTILGILREAEVKEGREREKLIREAREWFLKVSLVDPHLPEELLPSERIGDKVKKLLIRLS